MMTKEEVVEIISYCEEHKMSYHKRLSELEKLTICTVSRQICARAFIRLAETIILTFEKWMTDTAGKVAENSRIGKAISYTYPLLPRLGRYVNDGKYRIDNNLVENAIRPLAIGRKNFLFCGNHDAAIRATIVYSLISSCKACGLDPRKWMEDVLLKITPYLIENRDLAELLPNHWALSTPTQSN